MIDPSYVDEIIQSLFRERDLLCLQLDLAWGNITEEQFEEQIVEENLLVETELKDDKELKAKLKTLRSFLTIPLDGSDLSMIFNCPIDQVHKLMAEILEEEKASNNEI